MSDRKSDEREEMEGAVGREQDEPGQPTRSMNERGELPTDAAREVEEIAEQQGSAQRGYTGDREEGTATPPEPVPMHRDPGGRPEGDRF